MTLLFYDFEVFYKNWMLVVIDYTTRTKTVIYDDVDKLKSFYEANKDVIWIGYNNRQFDQYIMKAIILSMNPYEVSNRMIIDGEKGYNIVPDADKLQMYNFDLSTGFHSLKQLESFMGSKIKETSVPFNIQRKLTVSEIKETEEYCTHDVEETINVFECKKEELDSQMALIEAFDLPMEMFNKTKAQLAAHILGARKSGNREDDFQLTFPPEIILSEKYQYIYDWYKNPANMNYEKSLVTRVANVEHVFAWGGLHGAIPNYRHEGIILCCDVASLYPAIMINWNFLSRNVENPEKYKQIRDTRLVLKKNKDPKQAPYKIVLNGTFGASKDKHNALYDPLMANNVCVAGQLLLLDLIDKLEPHGLLIQSNTDGLFFRLETEDKIEVMKSVAKEWEIRTGLDLEWEVFTKIFQKDVNNYIIIDKKGKYKSKGAYVKKLSKTDYDLPIVNQALIQYFVNSIPVEETINNCNYLIEFQKTVKISSLYSHALHGDIKIKEKVLRVFASIDQTASGVFKVKGESKVEKIGNTPEHCFINNDCIRGVVVPETLDKSYYIALANKRIDDFVSEKNKSKTSSISSGIKFVNFNSKEILEQIYSENEFDSFVDFLIYVTENTHVDKRSIETLIKLNYFSQFGGNITLLNIFEQFKCRYKKTYVDVTKQKRILELYEFEKNVPEQCMSVKTQLAYETEVLGSPSCIFNVQKGTGYVVELNTNYSPRVTLYGLSNGNTTEMKINKKIFNKQPLSIGDIILITGFEKKQRNVMIDGEWTALEGKFDFWIKSYKLLKIENLPIDTKRDR